MTKGKNNFHAAYYNLNQNHAIKP